MGCPVWSLAVSQSTAISAFVFWFPGAVFKGSEPHIESR